MFSRCWFTIISNLTPKNIPRQPERWRNEMLSKRLIRKLLPFIVTRVMHAVQKNAAAGPMMRRVPVRVRGFSRYRD